MGVRLCYSRFAGGLVSGEHSPFEDSSGKFRLELGNDADLFSFDRFKVNAIEGVLGHTVGAGWFDGFPLSIFHVVELPACRDAALSVSGVIEPVDFDAIDRTFGLKVQLNPLFGALVVPPGEARDGFVGR